MNKTELTMETESVTAKGDMTYICEYDGCFSAQKTMDMITITKKDFLNESGEFEYSLWKDTVFLCEQHSTTNPLLLLRGYDWVDVQGGETVMVDRDGIAS